MKKLLLTTLILLITSWAYGQGIKWYENFAKGWAEAKRSGKPMMIDFYTDWCHWCGELDKKVYTDPHVIKLAEDKAKSSYSLGKNYEANKMYPQAIREYQRVISEYPNTIWARKAEERIKIIKSKQR